MRITFEKAALEAAVNDSLCAVSEKNTGCAVPCALAGALAGCWLAGMLF